MSAELRAGLYSNNAGNTNLTAQLVDVSKEAFAKYKGTMDFEKLAAYVARVKTKRLADARLKSVEKRGIPQSLVGASQDEIKGYLAGVTALPRSSTFSALIRKAPVRKSYRRSYARTPYRRSYARKSYARKPYARKSARRYMDPGVKRAYKRARKA